MFSYLNKILTDYVLSLSSSTRWGLHLLLFGFLTISSVLSVLLSIDLATFLEVFKYLMGDLIHDPLVLCIWKHRASAMFLIIIIFSIKSLKSIGMTIKDILIFYVGTIVITLLLCAIIYSIPHIDKIILSAAQHMNIVFSKLFPNFTFLQTDMNMLKSFLQLISSSKYFSVCYIIFYILLFFSITYTLVAYKYEKNSVVYNGKINWRDGVLFTCYLTFLYMFMLYYGEHDKGAAYDVNHFLVCIFNNFKLELLRLGLWEMFIKLPIDEQFEFYSEFFLKVLGHNFNLEYDGTAYVRPIAMKGFDKQPFVMMYTFDKEVPKSLVSTIIPEIRGGSYMLRTRFNTTSPTTNSLLKMLHETHKAAFREYYTAVFAIPKKNLVASFITLDNPRHISYTNRIGISNFIQDSYSTRSFSTRAKLPSVQDDYLPRIRFDKDLIKNLLDNASDTAFIKNYIASTQLSVKVSSNSIDSPFECTLIPIPVTPLYGVLQKIAPPDLTLGFIKENTYPGFSGAGGHYCLIITLPDGGGFLVIPFTSTQVTTEFCWTNINQYTRSPLKTQFIMNEQLIPELKKIITPTQGFKSRLDSQYLASKILYFKDEASLRAAVKPAWECSSIVTPEASKIWIDSEFSNLKRVVRGVVNSTQFSNTLTGDLDTTVVSISLKQ